MPREWPIQMTTDELEAVLGALEQVDSEYGLRVGTGARGAYARGTELIDKVRATSVAARELEPKGA